MPNAHIYLFVLVQHHVAYVLWFCFTANALTGMQRVGEYANHSLSVKQGALTGMQRVGEYANHSLSVKQGESNMDLDKNENDDSLQASSNLANRFQADGFLGPIDVLTSHEAAGALDQFNEWRATLPNATVQGDLRFKVHLFLPFVNHIVHHPQLVAAVRAVLGSDLNILCWSTDWNIKAPMAPQFYAPHQDAAYAGLEPACDVVTAWVALSDPVSERDGCLQFWPGSHGAGALVHTTTECTHNMLSRGQSCEIPGTLPVSIPLRVGQATLHSFNTVHQSGPNRCKDRSRVGLAIRYMKASVRQSGRFKESVTIVSGNMVHTDFDLEPVLSVHPTAEDLQHAMEIHKDAVQRETANYFETYL
jgi:Phytanoyl-CoA dioxygenase (PhyH)